MEVSGANSALSAVAAGWKTTLAARTQQEVLEFANLGSPDLEQAASLLTAEGEAIAAAGVEIAKLSLTEQLIDVLA